MVRLEPVLLQIPCDAASVGSLLLVRVISDDDVAYGEAELADTDVLVAAVDFFGDAVTHTDPLDFGLTWQRLIALLNEYQPDPLGDYMAVLGAVDVALWDLAGRKLGVPCHRLAGGLRTRRLDCYAGGLRVGQDDLPATAKALAAQFGAVELALSGDAAQDVPAIHRVRRAVGESTPLMADAGGGYGDLAAARQVGEAIEQVEGFWYESPLPAGRWEDHADLRRTLGTGLAGGRGLVTLADHAQALEAEALDILVADVRRCGGLSGARRLADLAQRHGVRMTLHNGPSPLAQAAAAHLAAAYWHVGPLQVEPMRSPLAELLTPPLDFARGFVGVPDGPGLGCRVQETIVAQYAMEAPDERPA